MLTFSSINTLQLYNNIRFYLHNHSEFKFNYYSKCSKCPLFSFTQA